MSDRQEVYKAIDGERNYQDSLCENNGYEGNFSTGEHLTLLATYIRKAQDAWSNEYGDEKALEEVRKLAAIAVRCLEQNNVEEREGWEIESVEDTEIVDEVEQKEPTVYSCPECFSDLILQNDSLEIYGESEEEDSEEEELCEDCEQPIEDCECVEEEDYCGKCGQLLEDCECDECCGECGCSSAKENNT